MPVTSRKKNYIIEKIKESKAFSKEEISEINIALDFPIVYHNNHHFFYGLISKEEVVYIINMLYDNMKNI